MGLLNYITQAFSGGWGNTEDQEHPFEKEKPITISKDWGKGTPINVPTTTEIKKEPYVIYDEDGIRIKANGEQLKFILGHLIATAKKSPILKLWLYLKCVPQEYKKLEIERDYYKGLYEKKIGFGKDAKEVVRGDRKSEKPGKQTTAPKSAKRAKVKKASNL